MNYRISQKLRIVALFLSLGGISLLQAQNFIESASTYNLNLGGDKDGGFAWGDYDNDGDLDLIVNTDHGSYKSRLLRNDGSTFTDVTSTLAPKLSVKTLERQAVWGDLNNDGYLDFLRNTGGNGSKRIEIYLQDPTTHIFGDGEGGKLPIYIGTSGSDDVRISDGMNSEGAGMFDLEGDGDLDIYFDNHNYGIDILRNNYIDHTTGTVVDPSASALFTYATSGTGTILGLAQSASDGDYGASADIDDDGWTDIFIRKSDENDFYMNVGGTFSNGADLGQATNSNKGGVGLYDLDNDGDFDAIWTDNDGNHLFENDGGTWTKLTGNLTIESRTDINGVAGGDIDNDGDIDLVFTGGSKSYLYINDINNGSGIGAGTAFQMDLSSTFDGYGDNDEKGNGVEMVDFDADGDLDIYINIDDDENQLWVNELYTSSTSSDAKEYIMIDVLENRSSRMQSGASRYAIGANVILKDCDGNVVSGIRNVNGGTGKGTQNPLQIHFGLPLGNERTYLIEVHFPNDSTSGVGKTRPIVSKAFNPLVDGSNLVRIEADDSDIACSEYDTDGDGVADLEDLDDDNDGILDCVEDSLSNSTFTDLFNIAGDASEISNTEIQLTSSSTSQLGSSFTFNPIDFSQDFDSIELNFGSNTGAGADGMAIVIHNDPDGSSASGMEGAGIGAADIVDGMAIEFDTYDNGTEGSGGGDLSNDHSHIWDTDDNTAISSPIDLGEIEDGTWYTVNFTWQASSQTFAYSFNGSQIASLSVDIINNYLGVSSTAYFGFTASTGTLTNDQRIRYTGNICDFPLFIDNDGDNITNSLDTDSDGDGCPDAIEGGASFSYDDLDLDDRLDHAFITQAGIDANGVPNAASSSGQGIGESQDDGSFDLDCAGGSSAPIELLSFTVFPQDNGTVEISWETLTESNNDYFTIERSRDAELWESVSQIKGAGDSQVQLKYLESDGKPFLGTSYYRLKQTDFNGEYSYSQIMETFMESSILMPLTIYPNPTKGFLSIEGSPEELSSYSFFDISGKDVTSEAKLLDRSDFRITFDISKLPFGVYLLKTSNETVKVEKE